MKRVDLIRHLLARECELAREGGKHSVFVSRRTRRSSTVPRHREINDFLARKICRDLEDLRHSGRHDKGRELDRGGVSRVTGTAHLAAVLAAACAARYSR